MNQAEIASEKAALVDKFFQCAEAPIHEWLAAYVKMPPATLFPDYTGNADVIGFMYEDTHYNAYLVPMPWGTDSLVDPQLLKTDKKTQKACSMLYDAVKQVFMAVTGAFESHNKDDPNADLFKSLIPYFDESKMAFHLNRVNWKALQLKTAYMQRQQIHEYIQKGNTLSPEQVTAVQQSVTTIDKIFNEIDKDALDEYEEKCKDTNEKIKLYDWLHIVVEKSDPEAADSLDNSMNRLPMFGLQYQDPDEENYIDKLKNEK